MRVSLLFGSPHKDGATAKAVQKFLASLSGEDSVDFFDSYQINAAPCLDCGACKESFSCVYSDLDEVFSSLLACDLAVIAAPIYNYSLPAPLKAIFDRCQPYYYQNFRSLSAETDANRKGGIILTAGRSGKTAFELVKKQALVFFHNLNISFDFELLYPNTDKEKLGKS